MSDNATAQAITPILPTIIPVITFILGLLGKVLYDLWHDNYIESKKRRENARKNHFEDLEVRVIKPIIDTTQRINVDNRGSLNVMGATLGSVACDNLITNFTKGDFYIFELHFPDIALKVKRLMDKVVKHEKVSSEFTNKLGNLITEKTSIPLSRGSGGGSFIYDDVPFILRDTLCQVLVNELPTNDFTKIRIEKVGDFWRVSNANANKTYAEVTNEDEANRCKKSLIELMQSDLLLGELSKIIESAKNIEDESKSISDFLAFTCREYGKFGTFLGKNSDCPYCQIVFHIKQGGKRNI